MRSSTLHRMLASAGILLSGTALAACASAATAGTGAPASSPGPTRVSAAAASYPGYKWRLVSISHDGKVIPIPAWEAPVMQFPPDGQFFATDIIHAYSGTYHAASDAFTTSNVFVSADGYIGNDPLILLTIGAMDQFGEHARHPVRLTGDQLVVSSGSYALTYHRAGRQANTQVSTGTG